MPSSLVVKKKNAGTGELHSAQGSFSSMGSYGGGVRIPAATGSIGGGLAG